MNPTDEWYALVRACELKEQQGGEVVVIHVGGADSEQIIRKALAIGADKAVRVDADPTDAYFVAAQIANHAKTENYDLIIAGKETIDYNSFQVGGMVAEFLDLPCVALVQKLEVANGVATLKREIEGGTETVEVKLANGSMCTERTCRSTHSKHERHYGCPHQAFGGGSGYG